MSALLASASSICLAAAGPLLSMPWRNLIVIPSPARKIKLLRSRDQLAMAELITCRSGYERDIVRRPTRRPAAPQPYLTFLNWHSPAIGDEPPPIQTGFQSFG
jgi:hypothetical protein